MILTDMKKGHIIIDGKRTRILTELSILIEELRSDLDEDEIMLGVKLGLSGNDLDKKIDVVKEMLEKEIKGYKNNENNKEIDI